MKQIHTETDIRTSAGRVWQVLTDFSSFPEWNPFMRQAHGDPRVGARLEVYLEPPGRRGIRIKPTVLKADPERELRWLGRLLIPGLFDGEHVFILEGTGDGRVRLTQSETFTGILVPLVTRRFLGDTRRGFEEMNEALKRRAEEA